ncbi:hypothetical protein EG329_011784 [Mollisiaceae sp. DMI_Dod_QoI]|nr:hypothetical protein EG329_011784 [Helotiales sp. DMI_Dod_QoI]
MAPSPLQQRRTHNTLLFQKLLNLREGASPFTLVLDTLEQSGGPVVRELAKRAKISKSKIIFISFSTLKKKVPFEVDSFITTRGKSLGALRTVIVPQLPPPPTTAPTSSSNATTQKRARDKSLQEPVFGLDERREGIVVGLNGTNSVKAPEVVVNMEIRRRSGRGVVENFVLMPPSTSASNSKLSGIGEFVLLDEHPLYVTAPIAAASDSNEVQEDVETTFNLNLTEKQKRDREGVVLPYFDAQKEGGAAGPGEGGRILYEMGAEDREDFDDEEDEI